MIYQTSVASAVCLTLVITGWTVVNKPQVAAQRVRYGEPAPVTLGSQDKQPMASSGWFSGLLSEEDTGKDTETDTSPGWWSSFSNPHSKGEQGATNSKGKWLPRFLTARSTGGATHGHVTDDLFEGYKRGFRILRESQPPWWILKPFCSFVQGLKKWLDNVRLNHSLLVLVFTLPYVPLFLLKLHKQSGFNRSKAGRGNRKEDNGSKSESVVHKLSDTEAEGIHSKFHNLQITNSNVEMDLNRKVSELKLMARLVEFLRRKCRQQAGEIQKRGSELEEMARTVEYLQRPSSKRWSDTIDRVYKTTYPEMLTIEHYQLFVPLDGAEKVDVQSNPPQVVEKDDSETEVSSGTELDWDEWG